MSLYMYVQVHLLKSKKITCIHMSKNVSHSLQILQDCEIIIHLPSLTAKAHKTLPLVQNILSESYIYHTTHLSWKITYYIKYIMRFKSSCIFYTVNIITHFCIISHLPWIGFNLRHWIYCTFCHTVMTFTLWALLFLVTTLA